MIRSCLAVATALLLASGCGNGNRQPKPGDNAMVYRDDTKISLFIREPDGAIDGLSPGTLVRVLGPVTDDKDASAEYRTRVRVLEGPHSERVGRVYTSELRPSK